MISVIPSVDLRCTIIEILFRLGPKCENGKCGHGNRNSPGRVPRLLKDCHDKIETRLLSATWESNHQKVHQLFCWSELPNFSHFYIHIDASSSLAQCTEANRKLLVLQYYTRICMYIGAAPTSCLQCHDEGYIIIRARIIAAAQGATIWHS